MLQQVVDLREEGDELFALVRKMGDGDWERHTSFKNWTVKDVIVHLHFSDWLAVTSAKDPDAFATLEHDLTEAMLKGRSMKDLADERLGNRSGPEVLGMWRDCFLEMCEQFGKLDSDARLKWFGPDMGLRMFATARQMETWAHGQEIYDLLKQERSYTDRIRNIAVIGVKTFGWTFVNRGRAVPGDIPYVRLTAPSGAVWEWNEPGAENRVEGSAVEFCHVVTQGRNIADVSLTVVGDTARQWMAMAQCFAGGAVDPPVPGERC
jgi:uncharacterized protein (TIGR03084 family)